MSIGGALKNWRHSHTSVLSKYLIMWIGGDPAFFLRFPTDSRPPTPTPTEPLPPLVSILPLKLHSRGLYVHHPTIFPFLEHAPCNAPQPRCLISFRTLLFYTTHLVNRQKSDRKTADSKHMLDPTRRPHPPPHKTA